MEAQIEYYPVRFHVPVPGPGLGTGVSGEAFIKLLPWVQEYYKDPCWRLSSPLGGNWNSQTIYL